MKKSSSLTRKRATALAILCTGPITAAAWAQEPAPPQTDTEAELNTVVVLGSRTGTATVLNSSAPVHVITSEELKDSGARTLSEALQAKIPSFNFPTSTPNSNAASFVKGVGLRGLATDETLVLINGKRRHATAQLNAGGGVAKGAQTVDLNSIPFSAIERVEVLLDNAAAQYGSDAIAGVVNIVLKERSKGSDLAVQYGGNSKGDGELRSFDGNLGLPLPGDGFLTIAADAWDVEATRLSTTDTRRMYFPGDPREASYPNRNWFYGNGATERYNLVLNAASTIGSATVYGFATYGWREDNGFGNLRQPNADQTVRALFPDGFQPWLEVESRDVSGTAGVKFGSDIAGHFDFSVTSGSNRVESVVYNTDNASLGLDSPTSFDTGDLLNEQTSVNLDWTRPLSSESASNSYDLAAGVNYRHEAYEVFEGDYGSWANGGVPILDGPNAGRIATPASQGFGGFSPDDASRLSRDVFGAYIELESDFADRFKVTLSARAEDYSDFGSTTNGRVALRWQIIPSLAWRGSASTGYRAPSLGQSAYSRTIPNITNGVLSTNRIAPVSSVLARTLGATDLTPEESTTFSTGLVWAFADRASITADVYQIDIDDRVVLSEVLRGPIVVAALTAAGYPTYSGLQYFTNAANTRTRGIDATARYGVHFERAGTLDFSLGYNRNETEITDIKPVPPLLAGSGLVLIGREAEGIIERANPSSFARLAVDYDIEKFDAHINAVRYGTYQAINGTSPTLDQTFDSQVVVDFRVGYQFTEAFGTTLGATNLLDSHPDEVLPAVRNPVVSVYSGLSPRGGAGTAYYARLNFTF